MKPPTTKVKGDFTIEEILDHVEEVYRKSKTNKIYRRIIDRAIEVWENPKNL